MNSTGNTILITGGGSGIGLETAKAFVKKGNFVILAGRNEAKLAKAVSELQYASYIVCDITDANSIEELFLTVQKEFSDFNILINNAGLAYAYKIGENMDAYSKASAEITTNYLANIRLTEKLLPLLRSKPQAAIINNTSVTAFVPGVSVATYSASKAALHSYTQSLRHILQQSSAVKVFEVMPPLVDTEFSKALAGDKIPPADVAKAIVEGLEKDIYEIHVGVTAVLHKLFLQSPIMAFNTLNRIV